MAAGSFYAQPAYSEPISAVTATPSVQLGSVRLEASEEYVYVYNNGTTQISVGNGAILSAVSGYSVTVSSVTGVGAFFGVCKHATLTTATYGWLLTKGFSTVTGGGNTAIAAADVLVPAANGGWAATTGALSAVVQGQAMIATATGGAGYAYVRCFGS